MAKKNQEAIKHLKKLADDDATKTPKPSAKVG
jgi:hypothetical protein